MKNYQEVFTRWSHLTTEELRASDDVGALIALALRTDDASLKGKAIEQMDYDTYNVLSVIPLLKSSSSIDSFSKNVKMYEPILVPALVEGINLDLTKESDVLLYAVEQLLPVADGFLSKILKHLDLLRKKPISVNSRYYANLISYRFSDFAIHYLNYVWLKDATSNSTLKKLQSNLLSVLFSREGEFNQLEREVIQQVLGDIPAYNSAISWTKDLECAPVANDNNWLWLYEFCKVGKMSINCIRIDPLVERDGTRFDKLSYEEKLFCIDNNVGRAVTGSSIILMLERLNFKEYLETFHRKLPARTFANAVKLELITLEKANNENVKEYLKGLPTKEAFEYFMEHSDSQSVYVITGSNFMQLRNETCVFKDYLDEADQRLFISKILDIIYNQNSRDYVFTLAYLLAMPKINQLYDNELLRSVVDFIQEHFIDKIGSFVLNQSLRNVIGDTEYEVLQAKLNEERELRRLKEKEEKVASQIKLISEDCEKCSSYIELLGIYNNYTRDWRFESKLVSKVVSEFVAKYHKIWDLAESFYQLIFLLWDSDAFDFEVYKAYLAIESEVC